MAPPSAQFGPKTSRFSQPIPLWVDVAAFAAIALGRTPVVLALAAQLAIPVALGLLVGVVALPNSAFV